MTSISVISVVKNAVSCIERCITSVLEQTYNNVEYLVIDGDSKDGTMDVISRYLENIDLVISEPDGGIYHAMNKGVSLATGDYVYFLNSDDYFCDKNVIADVANAIRLNPSVDLVYGDIMLRNADQFTRKPQVPTLSRETLCRSGFCHQSLFAKRDLFERVGQFSLDYSIVADGDWLARTLAAKASSLHINRDIAIFSMGGFSTTRNIWRKEKKKFFRENFTRWERLKWRKLPGLIGRSRNF